MKSALIDASSAILLYKAKIFDDVCLAYHLLVVPAVYAEITVARRSGATAFRQAYARNRIERLKQPCPHAADQVAMALGTGERDTVAAYLEGASHFVIIDDGKGAQACRVNGIPHINALLCAKILLHSGLIESDLFESAFNHLLSIGRYSLKVIEYAQACTSEMLADFFPSPLPSPQKGVIL